MSKKEGNANPRERMFVKTNEKNKNTSKDENAERRYIIFNDQAEIIPPG